MMAQITDWWACQEMAMARAEPKLIPAFVAFLLTETDTASGTLSS